ncbi:uncharacterized protein LOC116291214 [Actinia tenebrosa]|uniref:Uncharacterized protein LOC116291214 n=1 Tax=Actinia tenebrosa TaxID=6105 RepID=A0A6P8HNG3_ACTTE|nr:uncharacterized protein LOC116291214 [Actinia tenebrosa]XP_031554215.1 uncharacterized protein LOC116291214 [Actinia tenebrosa]
MIRIFQASVLVLLVLDVVNAYPLSSYQTYFRLFGRHLRKRRAISDTIKSCSHWKINHSDDPDITDVVVALHNSASSVKKISTALQCQTMIKIKEPNLGYKIEAGAMKEVLFSIAVSPLHFHHDSRVRRHTCLLSTWTEDANSYVTCKIKIPVWPNGLFFYNCRSYAIGQMTVTQRENDMGTQIRLHNTGPKALFMVNSTCDPTIMTLTHTNKYKRLYDSEEWTLSFPASCDGRVGINYKGSCSVKVYHVCLTTTTFIDEVKFDFVDGETKECEYRKSHYTTYSAHWLQSLLGLNDLLTALLVPVVFLLMVTIIITLVIKFFLLVHQRGSLSAAKKEFRQRFRGIFQARLANITS